MLIVVGLSEEFYGLFLFAFSRKILLKYPIGPQGALSR
jgi:hypothetical protein